MNQRNNISCRDHIPSSLAEAEAGAGAGAEVEVKLENVFIVGGLETLLKIDCVVFAKLLEFVATVFGAPVKSTFDLGKLFTFPKIGKGFSFYK